MSEREWKPGDVAMLSISGESARAVVATSKGGFPVWQIVGHSFYQSIAVGNDVLIQDARPLVVIDPEDREQVDRLRGVLGPHLVLASNILSKWQEGLREFADPKPPKPNEPTELGAVVEDSCGVRWVRTEDKPNITGTVWTSAFHASLADRAELREYADIAAVKVLSEGVTS